MAPFTTNKAIQPSNPAPDIDAKRRAARTPNRKTAVHFEIPRRPDTSLTIPHAVLWQGYKFAAVPLLDVSKIPAPALIFVFNRR